MNSIKQRKQYLNVTIAEDDQLDPNSGTVPVAYLKFSRLTKKLQEPKKECWPIEKMKAKAKEVTRKGWKLEGSREATVVDLCRA